MVEMRNDRLIFSFPEVHASATLSVEFQRTLRIPDNNRTHRLPPGLGRFPLRHVDDGTSQVPAEWIARGGVMLPMYQAEAMWIRFEPGFDNQRNVAYPFAIAVAAGKINAVTGQQWTGRIHPDPQDYAVAPRQPWLDGFCVEKGTIRQFVAMPLGGGYTAEEQITGEAEYGGVQLLVFPMQRACFEQRFPIRDRVMEVTRDLMMPTTMMSRAPGKSVAMGLGAGGRMKQEIYRDPFGFDEWDQSTRARCFVHIANSDVWRACTGEAPPTKPPTAADYSAAGLPWFDYYGEGAPVEGSAILRGLKSVLQLGQKKGETPIPDNAPVSDEQVVTIRRRGASDEVREGTF